jgi:hypothetical protein
VEVVPGVRDVFKWMDLREKVELDGRYHVWSEIKLK